MLGWCRGSSEGGFILEWARLASGAGLRSARALAAAPVSCAGPATHLYRYGQLREGRWRSVLPFRYPGRIGASRDPQSRSVSNSSTWKLFWAARCLRC